MFRTVRTVSSLCSHSSAPVPRLLLLRCDAASKNTFFRCNSSSSPRCFSSDTAAPALPYATDNNKKKNFSVSSMFQLWKNKFQQENITPSIGVSAVEDTSPSKSCAINLAMNSVVKVFTVSSKPRLFQPWQISMQDECTGSGFVISGRRLLTNAHVVEHYTSVKVKRHDSPKKYKAKVKAIGNECDLAILEIDSEEFWEGMNVLELGDIPSEGDSVAVVGFPCGGDSISVTKGSMSRLEARVYSHSSTELLAIQIDAAINSGNSGGPVIMENKVVGVAFETLCSADNIGYIIPTPVIQHFLNGVEESGQHVNFCSLNFSYQTMSNEQIRNHYKMRKDMTGILVNKVNPLSDAQRFLQKNDVVLAIDGIPIANDSTVPFRKQKQITCTHLVSMKKPSETASLKVLREGKEHEFNISLKPVQPLVPRHHFDKLRSYYIFAGFVFVPLSEPYIRRSYNICGCASKMLPKKAGEQIVIISQILEDDINADYDVFEDFQVRKVNGVQVDNLKHLCELIEECCSGDVVLDLEKDKVIVLSCKPAKKATLRIMKNLKIPSAMSDDLGPRQLIRCRVVPRKIRKK